MESVEEVKFWLIFRAAKSARQKIISNSLQVYANSNMIPLSIAHATERRLTREGDGRRRIDVLKPRDAHTIFLDMLQMRTVIFAEGGIFVQLNPMKDPPRKTDCATLIEFVSSKGRIITITDDGSDISSLAKSAVQDITESGDEINDVNDPRLLPMHVFMPFAPLPQLDNSRQREKFRRDYRRTGGVWVGDDNNVWKLPHSNLWHASPQSHSVDERVGTFALPHGLHWDVNNIKGPAIVSSTSEVWKIERGGYLNVYPNENIRGSKASKRIWTPNK